MVWDRKPEMNYNPVDSTALRVVGYDPASQVLEIEFSSGGVYQYFDVPETIYAELMDAPSHGQYFQSHIRDVYRYQRME